MTYKDLEATYDCKIYHYTNNMDDSVQIKFMFPGYEYHRTITQKQIDMCHPKQIEDEVCRLALDRYFEHNAADAAKKLVGVGSTLQETLDNFNAAFNKTKDVEISECYSIGFDISSSKDVSVATVCKVIGNRYHHVATFTGEEAEWMYYRVTNIKV